VPLAQHFVRSVHLLESQEDHILAERARRERKSELQFYQPMVAEAVMKDSKLFLSQFRSGLKYIEKNVLIAKQIADQYGNEASLADKADY